ncbi:MAG: hypothetical protein GY814_13330 [Gammaproteobacteria bacterium]|nr:hypothetical protein [Gammaproteobacteria bacterium]
MLPFAIGLILIGIALIIRGVSRLRLRRRLRCSIYWSSGVVSMLSGMFLLAVAANLYTYHRLTSEIAVAEIEIRLMATNSFELRVIERDKPPISFTLYGDEWQLDARFLRWKSWATLLGKDPLFALERLSGRYGDIEQERSARRSVHSLNSRPGLDIWKYGRKYSQWIPFVDAYYGSSVYVPLESGARYEVIASHSGLMVRAKNVAAAEALKDW